MSGGASVGSIYSQMILDTSQYESALRSMVGISSTSSKKAAKSLDATGKSIDNTTDKVKHQSKEVGNLSQTFAALGGVIGSAAVIGGLKLFVGQAGKMETLNTSFRVLLGSAEKAKEVIKELNTFSTITPFTPEQTFNAGKALLAYGFEAKALIPTLQAIGDVAAISQKDFNELTAIYGKARIAGRLYAEDLNQLTEAGIPILKELGVVMGVNEKAITKMASEGKIGFAELEKAFQGLTTGTGLYANGMVEQSKTMEGMISTMQGGTNDLSIAIGEQLLPASKALVGAISAIVGGLVTFSKENPVLFGTIVKLVAGIALLVAILVGAASVKMAVMTIIPMLKLLGLTAIQTGAKMAFAFGPAGAAFIAIMAIIALVGVANSRMARLNVARVDTATQSITRMNAAQRETAKLMIGTYSITSTKLTKATQQYRDLDATVRSLGLTMEQFGRTSRNKREFTVNPASMAAVRDGIQTALQAEASRNHISIPVQVTPVVTPVVTGTGSGEKVSASMNTGMFEPLVSALKEGFGVEIPKSAKVGLGAVSMFAEGFMNYLSVMAQAAQQNFANMQQKIGTFSEYSTAIIDRQTESAIAALDLEAEALQAQKDRLIAIEEDYVQRRNEIRNAEIDAIKDRIEAEYQLQADKLQLEYEDNLLRQETDMADEDQRRLNNERLQEEHLIVLADTRQRFDDMTVAEIQALTDTMSSEDRTRENASKVSLAALALQEKENEQKKLDIKESADAKKAELGKKLQLFEWAMGKKSFEANKQMQQAQIQIQMAQGLITAVIAGTIITAFLAPLLGPFALPVGIAAGGALSAMVLSSGMASLQAVGQSQYQPPPAAAFADGGMITGGIPNRDSVNVSMMPGELVVPTRNFEEVIGAVQNQRSGGAVTISGNNFYGIERPEQFVETVQEMLLEKMRTGVAAFG